MQPRLSISPVRRGPRPSSAKSRGAEVPVHAASSRAGLPRSHFAAVAGSSAGAATAAPTLRPSSAVRRSATGNSTASAAVPLEGALVANLKQQISCLELEVKFLKNENEKLAPTEQQQQHGGVSLNQSQANPLNESLRHSAGAADLRSSHSDLLAHAGRLEREVADLRERFAVREQEHALEVAGLRGPDGNERPSHSGGYSGSAATNSGFQRELERRSEQQTREMTQMKEAHAAECVGLQKSMEQMQLESQAAQAELTALRRSRDAAVQELTAAKDAWRTLSAEKDVAQGQREKAVQQLLHEQERRRQLESREDAVRKEANDLRNDTVPRLNSRIAELEKALRDANASTAQCAFERDQLKLTNDKMREDLLAAGNAKADSDARAEHFAAEQRAEEEQRKRLEGALADATSERDFYRLSLDKLKVEQSVQEVKIAQCEAKINSDRGTILTLERQHCAALDEAERLRRQLAAQQELHRSLEGMDDTIRRKNKILLDENNHFVSRIRILEGELSEIRDKFESVRGFAEQAKAESQIMAALTKLDRAKQEMSSIVQTQMKVAHDVSTAIYGIPDAASVSRVTSPPRESRGYNDVSGIAPEPQELTAQHAMLPLSHAALVTPLAAPSPSNHDVVNAASTPAAPSDPGSVTASAQQHQHQHKHQHQGQQQQQGLQAISPWAQCD